MVLGFAGHVSRGIYRPVDLVYYLPYTQRLKKHVGIHANTMIHVYIALSMLVPPFPLHFWCQHFNRKIIRVRVDNCDNALTTVTKLNCYSFGKSVQIGHDKIKSVIIFLYTDSIDIGNIAR